MANESAKQPKGKTPTPTAPRRKRQENRSFWSHFTEWLDTGAKRLLVILALVLLVAGIIVAAIWAMNNLAKPSTPSTVVIQQQQQQQEVAQSAATPSTASTAVQSVVQSLTATEVVSHEVMTTVILREHFPICEPRGAIGDNYRLTSLEEVRNFLQADGTDREFSRPASAAIILAGRFASACEGLAVGLFSDPSQGYGFGEVAVVMVLEGREVIVINPLDDSIITVKPFRGNPAEMEPKFPEKPHLLLY